MVESHAQDCPDPLRGETFEGNFQWYRFPEFSLPFKVIYGNRNEAHFWHELHKRGFSHLSYPAYTADTPADQRVFIYYNVALLPQQPWYVSKSPWGNDMQVYHQKWDEEIARFTRETGGNLDVRLFALDIEMMHKSSDSILVLKNKDYVPQNIRNLTNENFIIQYKKDMQALYAYAGKYIQAKAGQQNIPFSSYTDAPVLNTFVNIQGMDWQSWQENPAAINYMAYDFEKKQVGGDFYQMQDFLTPSAYFYYDYPHIFAGEYLSYLMFQVEVNEAWSDKEQILFLWNQYSWTPEYNGKPIRPWMSEAMAIFPFFSGAKGIWLWDDLQPNSSYNNYNYFMKGMYRLSHFNHFFEGDYRLVKSISARDYNENKLPVWRGVYKDGKILVVAQNPWARSETEEVKLNINYGSLKKEITLKGYEIHLCEYPVGLVTANEIEVTNLKLYPNPTSRILKYTFRSAGEGPVKVKVYDGLGRARLEKQLDVLQNYETVGELDVSALSQGEYFVQFSTKDSHQTKKIIIQP